MLIYEIPNDERFTCFVNFNEIKDLGFKPYDLKMEASTSMVFITSNRKTRREAINIMIIDPYYESFQISLFQSSSYFNTKSSGMFTDSTNGNGRIYQNKRNEIKLLL